MILYLENISHRYGKPPVKASAGTGRSGHEPEIEGLEAVSLTVSPGEIVSLFGPSGCGKTTLLRLVAGHEALQSGLIRLDDQVLATAERTTPPEHRPFGYVFQDFVLFPHLTVEDNIRFGLADKSRSEQRAEVARRIEQMQLRGLEKRYPHELSGGQQQRVAMARALARRPRVLLLDEPFASLDIGLRRTLQDEFRRVLRADGMAALFVTHDPDEALTMGDRIALLRGGRLLSVATPHDYYNNPTSREAALLFAGHQTVTGTIIGHEVQTLMGNFRTDEFGIEDVPQGPVEIVLCLDDVAINPTQQGQLIVEDCRFAGPGWLVIARAAATDQLESSIDTHLRFPAKQKIAAGTRLNIIITRSAIKFIDPLH